MTYHATTLTDFSADNALAGMWLRMRHKLWPHASEKDHERDALMMADAENLVVLALDRQQTGVGFAEISCRPWANGCESSPVAYLEGVYVEPAHRGKQAADAMLDAAQEWAIGRGMTEFASDAGIDNGPSVAAHAKWGFTEVMRVACFRKTLNAAS